MCKWVCTYVSWCIAQSWAWVGSRGGPCMPSLRLYSPCHTVIHFILHVGKSAWMYVYHMHAWCPQKRVSRFPETGIRIVLSHLVGPGNQTQVICWSSNCSKLLSHLLSPTLFFGAGSLIGLELMKQLIWLSSKPQEIYLSILPMLGLQVGTTMPHFLKWVLRIKLRSSCLTISPLLNGLFL